MRISSRRFASRADSGSSSSSTSGSMTMARASAMRCCCPPESSDGSFCSTPGRRTISRARRTRSPIAALAHAAVFQAEADVGGDCLVRKQGIVLEDETDVALVDRHLVHAAAVDPDFARGRVHQPGDGAQDRRLAAAGRPQQRDEGALVDGEVDFLHGDEGGRSASVTSLEFDGRITGGHGHRIRMGSSTFCGHGAGRHPPLLPTC